MLIFNILGCMMLRCKEYLTWAGNTAGSWPVVGLGVECGDTSFLSLLYVELCVDVCASGAVCKMPGAVKLLNLLMFLLNVPGSAACG